MNLLKRACLYITRRKGKSILLFFILVIIITLVLSGISIGSAADAAAAALRQNLGGYFKVETDLNKPAGTQFVDDKLAGEISSIKGVKAYSGLNIIYLTAKDLKLTPGRFTGTGDTKAQLARFLGNTDTALNEYFLTRTFDLTQGRPIGPEDKGKVLISETLAAANHLKIGDTVRAAITQDTTGQDSSRGIGQTFGMQVVGIFKVNNPQPAGFMTPECDIADNFIFTDTATARAVYSALGVAGDRYRYGATFTVTDPKDLGSIVSGVQSLAGVDWSSLKITVNDKAYKDSVVPLQRLSEFTGVLILVILIVSVILLSLILTLWMRDRVHEMGVYLSIGIGKLGIIGQFIVESVIIAVLAFCLSWGISGTVAGFAGNAVLKNLTAQEAPVAGTAQPTAYFNDTVGLQTGSKDIQTVDIKVGAGEFFTVVGLGMLIIVISVGVSSILVIRMKPRDILSTIS